MLHILEFIAIGGPTLVVGIGAFCWCFPDLVSSKIPEITENEIDINPTTGKKTVRLDDLLHG